MAPFRHLRGARCARKAILAGGPGGHIEQTHRRSGRPMRGARPLPPYHSRKRVLSLAIDWLCNWQTRLSVTPSTAAISFRFMSCS